MKILLEKAWAHAHLQPLLQVSCLALSVPRLSPAIRTISQAKLSVFLETHKARLKLPIGGWSEPKTKKDVKE